MFDKDLGLEVDPGVHAQVLVRRPGVAVAASMSTAPVRIDAVAKGYVWAVVLADDALCVVMQVDRLHGAALAEKVVVLGNVRQIFRR